MSEIILQSLKQSIGLTIGFYNLHDFYFQGEVLAVDDFYLKFKDRKTGVRIIPLSEIKEVFLK